MKKTKRKSSTLSMELKHKLIAKLKIDETKLQDYNYVDELHHLTTGAYVRWVNLNTMKLTNGGFVVRVDIEEEGTRIMCKKNNRFFQFWMDECVVFQKLSVQELIIREATHLI
jgi:hypothetical protein